MKQLLLFFSLSIIVLEAASQFPINLHIVPHTHNDLGWLETVESYYLGTNTRGCVECILDNITQALSENPNRRFSYVEIGYFRIWWSQQTPETQQKFIQLHQNGQIEFLNAGVVMNDEGAAYYDDIIEQMTKGLRYVQETFNQTVQTAWHIDPFGHSAAQASIFSQMGFNSWFIERIDYQDKDNRILNSNLETIWKPHTFSDINYILTHVNYMDYYKAPLNWCIDVICFTDSTPFDAMQRMFKYATWVQNQTNFYGSNQIIHHVGGDFEWSKDANSTFQGLEVIIDFFNAHQEFKINPFFSTPRNYTDNLYDDFLKQKISPLTKNDDFMPYADVPHAFWTGYYTSRASFKREVRVAGQRLQTIKKLLTKVLLQKPNYSKISYSDFAISLDQYEEVNAIMQHHDAVAGTATENVTVNYLNMLDCGTNQINQVIINMINLLNL